MLIFVNSHQDPSCRVLDVLEPLQALARDPDEKCVTRLCSNIPKGGRAEKLFASFTHAKVKTDFFIFCDGAVDKLNRSESVEER